MALGCCGQRRNHACCCRQATELAQHAERRVAGNIREIHAFSTIIA
jgi:hypothetical protein